MSTGYIRADVFLFERALPVEGAKVTITRRENGEIVFSTSGITDAQGVSPIFEVPAPPAEISRIKQSEQKPYETYDLLVEAPEFFPANIAGIQVFAEQTAVQLVEMVPLVRGKGGPAADTNVVIPPHQLFKSAPDSGMFVIGPEKEPRTLKEPVIPETVVVHLGKPSANAPNVYVPFKDYIKNVASSEIYPTWGDDAIKTNVYAQISFTLNRIYTEWYRSRGYNFQITNSTAYDQAYIHGRNIYDNISRIVDEIFDQYIHRPGTKSPLFASYCDGRQTQCNGLKQWGSFELANQGFSPEKILNYYYGPVELSTARQVAGIPESYPGNSLRLGDTGEDVKRIQTWLTRIAKNYPAIGVVPVTGVFDERTQEAVKVFQRIFDLTADGIVGKATWYKIVQIYVAVTKLGELDAELEENDNLIGSYPGYVIKQGQRGANVRAVQSVLALLSTFYEEIAPVDVDGIFGAGTTTAVKQFQQLKGLTVDGLVGRATWNALREEYIAVQGELENSQNPGDNKDPYPGVLLREGSRGDSVKKMQNYINELAKTTTGLQTTNADGIFGPNTKSQIISYQKKTRVIT